ncbi:MAG: complex I subunit 1 family protein [Candidatus Methanomethylicia archaeon]
MHVLELVLIPLLCFILGILLNYEVRKVYARSQYRLGPLLSMYGGLRSIYGSTRILQPLYDVLKLFFKETIIPKSARKWVFILSPLISFILALLTSYFISYGGLSLLSSNSFSIIFITYLFIGISFFWVFGGLASSSSWSIVGSRREAELLLSIEVALLSSIFSSAIISNSLSIDGIINFQLLSYPMILLNPFAAIVFIIAILGKLHFNPFEIPEADVEIVSGPYTEYSGKLLALILSSRYILTTTLVGLFVNLFLCGGIILNPINIYNQSINIIIFVVECFIVMFIISLIHSIAPRFRIDQALSWSIKYLWPLSAWSIIFSLIIKSILGGS